MRTKSAVKYASCDVQAAGAAAAAGGVAEAGGEEEDEVHGGAVTVRQRCTGKIDTREG